MVKALQQKVDGWKESEDGIITWKDRIYVPVDRKLREEIVQLHHDSPLAGHPGRHKTHELIKGIIGGQRFKSLSTSMWKDVNHVNAQNLNGLALLHPLYLTKCHPDPGK